MKTDSELLEIFSAQKEQSAFATLVDRHLNLVYNTALRAVGGDSHLAEDVSQTVFTALALKAGRLSSIRSLGGWLYRSAKYEASNVIRKERSRKQREQETYLMKIDEARNPEDSEVDWEALRPTIDTLMASLSKRDQDAVALRFFESQSYATIASRFSISENAARMRVTRAIEKMRSALTKKRVGCSYASLAAALSSQNSTAAPVGLGASLNAIAIAATNAVPTLFVSKLFIHFSNAMNLSIYLLAAVTLAASALSYQTGNKLEKILAEIANNASTTSIEPQQAVFDVLATKPPEANQSISLQEVEKRYRRAEILDRSGKYGEALVDYLWCFDTGMPLFSRFQGVRTSFLLSSIAKMGKAYPPALDALLERRAALDPIVRSQTVGKRTLYEWTSLNRSLQEKERSYELYSSLPENDPRKPFLARRIFSQLVENGRYLEAMATTSYQKMLSLSERRMAPPPAFLIKQPLPKSSLAIDSAIECTETLAGVGQKENAVKFAMHLLEYDDSPETKEKLKACLERAKASELFQLVTSE